MSYNKLGFTSGQTLKAEHLNHMEEGIANAGGVSSWNDLTDKPFGEEISLVSEPLHIVWDGDTSCTSVKFLEGEDGGFYKVSDIVLTNEQIRSAKYFYKDDDNEVFCSEEFDSAGSEGFEHIIITDDIVVLDGIAIVRKNNVTIDMGEDLGSKTFPEKGIYLLYEVEQFYVETFITTESVEQELTVIEKLDKKYLPEDDRVMVIHATPTSDTYEEYTVDKSYQDVKSHLDNDGIAFVMMEWAPNSNQIANYILPAYVYNDYSIDFCIDSNYAMFGNLTFFIEKNGNCGAYVHLKETYVSSPNGTKYEIRVDDSGTLSTRKL